ncbi:MAG: ribosome-associated translation inhibitor RaiA [Chloroflexi bacterium]|nr:ribosome-associated translation inhibitor RaiA [Chloroflexota bacterium]
MEVLFQERNLEVPQETKEAIEKKIVRLSKKQVLITQAQVEFTREHTRASKDRIVAEVTLNCNGTLLRAEERAANVSTAVDAAISVLTRRLNHYKGKLYRSDKSRRTEKAAFVEEQPPRGRQSAQEQEELSQGKVVRVKRFAVELMSVEEAATRMELLGHLFFLFRNADSGNYNLLYRRRDGDYGLIEPIAE